MAERSKFALPLLLLSGLAAFAQVPAAPTNLEASDRAFPHQITLSWDHVRNATSYRVFRSLSNDVSTAAQIGTTQSILYADPVGKTGFNTSDEIKTFFYWVQAVGSNGASTLAGPEAGSTARRFSQTSLEPFSVPVPDGNPLTGAKIYLGKTLFWDEQLSSTKTVACGTCHSFRNGGSDARPLLNFQRSTHPGPDGVFGTEDDAFGSRGVPRSGPDGLYRWSTFFGLREQVTPRKALPVTDGSFGPQGVLWDGKAAPLFVDPKTGSMLLPRDAALESQALIPFLNTTEMAHEGRTLEDVTKRIQDSAPLALSASIPPPLARWIGARDYPALFEEAFGTPEITPVNLAMAVASYVRTLLPDRTLFDATLLTQSAGNGLLAAQAGDCLTCHDGPRLADGKFRVTGVRPPQEDAGHGAISGTSQDAATFRVPSLRNAAYRATFFHTGRKADVQSVIDFYSRGGDFHPANIDPLIRSLNLGKTPRNDVASLLLLALTDQRAAGEKGPLFDRPLLYTESARVPVIGGISVAAGDGSVPQMIALEPPLRGNQRFTVALADVPAGASAVLVIDKTDPGLGPLIPAVAAFARVVVQTSDNGQSGGFASVNIPIPDDAALDGVTFVARWYVTGGDRLSVSQPARFTVFAPRADDGASVVNVSSASLIEGAVGTGSIVTAFGTGLATATISADSSALPASLGGVSITVTDHTGTSAPGLLYFVSPNQINYVLPTGVAEGDAVVHILRDGQEVAHGSIQLARSAPTLFAANGDGLDAAAAIFLREPASGSASTQLAAEFAAGLGRRAAVPVPINAGDQLFLSLFGTGIRNHEQLSVTIGGTPVEVQFAGPQGSYPGFDQVNVKIPASLAGRGEMNIVLIADGRLANIVRVAIQ